MSIPHPPEFLADEGEALYLALDALVAAVRASASEVLILDTVLAEALLSAIHVLDQSIFNDPFDY